MAGAVERIMGSRPARTVQHYGQAKGAIFAQGMTLSAFFSLFAALFIGFAVFAAVLGDNAELRGRVIDAVAGSVPGLIDQSETGGADGVLDVEALVSSSIIGWGAAVAAVGILVTAIGWIAASRDGFRTVFGLPDLRMNVVALRAGDLGVAAGIGLLVLVSAAVLAVSSAILEDWLGLGGLGVVIGIVVQLALDTGIVALLYRFAGHLRLPAKQLLGAAFACAVAFAILKQFAALLLSGGSNPLIASFAAIIGILIWLRFVNQILLVALAWIAVGTVGTAYARLEDVEIARDEAIEAAKADRERLKAERAEREKPDPKQSLLMRRLHKRLTKQR